MIGAARDFARSEDGTVSIEALLWFVMIILVTTVMMDAYLLFDTETAATKVIQDANRAASLGRLTTSADVELFIESRLAALSPNATATATFDASGMVRSSVTIPAGDVGVSGILSSLAGLDLTVGAIHLIED